MARFYCSTRIPNEPTWCLPETVFHHAVRVLRMSIGDQLTLFDGTGYEYLAQITEVDKHKALVNITRQQLMSRESPLNLCLAQALLNHDKMDWVIQKAVELGVKEITPLITERSIVKIATDKMQQRMERWQNIIISACEQSGRNILPIITAPISLSHWLPSLTASQRIVLKPNSRERLDQLTINKKEQVVFIVGPEGGLSDEEIALLLTHQFTGISLGPRILRTETAGLAVLSCAQLLWGDFNNL